MPRLCLRLIGILPLAWLCLLGTWLFLPSPTIRNLERDGYIQARLRSGAAVTTVAEFNDSFKKTNMKEYSRGGTLVSTSCSDCVALILDWRLENHVASDSVMLHIGEARINLTGSALQFSRTEKGSGKEGVEIGGQPYVSEPIMARLRAGALAHVIIMPWFNWADRILIHWTEYMGRENIYLRVLVPASGVVEIWKDDPSLRSLFSASQLPGIRDTDREVGMLAAISNVPTTRIAGAHTRANTVQINVSHVQGKLPSKTWPIRSIICGPLYVPTFMLIDLVWLFISIFIVPSTIPGALVEAVVVVGLVIWLCNPRRQRLCGRRVRQTRSRGIWSVAGPVMPDEETGLLKEKARIRPLAMSVKSLRLMKPSQSRSRVFDKY